MSSAVPISDDLNGSSREFDDELGPIAPGLASDVTLHVSNVISTSPPPAIPNAAERRRIFFGYQTQNQSAEWTCKSPELMNNPRARREENKCWPACNANGKPEKSLLSTSLETSTPKERRIHHVHAQSLVLGLAFCAVWTPSNLMAPNLTAMAVDFSLDHRDFWLGSVPALVTFVASLPLAAALGVWAERQSRVQIWSGLLLTNAAATGACAYAQRYFTFLLCRWWSGACMGASVPVAFSLLGDWFGVHERNVASSGLTASMGLGILGGQVVAGSAWCKHWTWAFELSSVVQLVALGLCMIFVSEPARGGREDALQTMMENGKKYDRTLTWDGFCHAIQRNASNRILLYQGFFSNLPWGVIFVFLNDYLSQERGFSVPDATFLVMVFGVGCAVGGMLGGWIGQQVQHLSRIYLPLFMAASTALGILPFLWMLNSNFSNAHGLEGLLTTFLGGMIASLPAVNIRPCLLNVNPPELRGASLTAANLLIQLGRGIGPSCVTTMRTIFAIDRQAAFNITLIVFWLISAAQLLFLLRVLPGDQAKMEADLATYAEEAMNKNDFENETTIEDRIITFDSLAAQQTFEYVREGIKEIREEVESINPFACGKQSSDEEQSISSVHERFRMEPASEKTPLLLIV